MDGVFSFIRGLAEALFDAFGGAVSNYPVSTLALVVAAAFLFFGSRENTIPIKIGSRTYYLFGEHRFLDGLVLFIGVAILANALGAVFSLIKDILTSIFGIGSVVLSPFDTYPEVYALVLLALTICSLGFAMVTKKTVLGVFGALSAFEFISGVIGVIIGTYVLTMIFGGVTTAPAA